MALVVPGFQASAADWCIPALTNLAARLSKSVELHVFALRYPTARREYRVGEVSVHSLGGGAFGTRRVVGVSLLRLWADTLHAIEREHRAAPFEAVVGIWATESGWLATRAAKRLRVPSPVHLAGGELVRLPEIGYGNRGAGLSGLLVRQTLRRADLLTVPSSTIRKALPDSVDGARVRDWALGVDTALFRPGEKPRPSDRPFTFVTVGSLIPVKGHDRLLHGLAQLIHEASGLEVALRIVGSGALRSTLENQAARLGISDRVEFLGEVAHDKLPALYAQADAFIIGSHHEAQCMAALEAMSCGLPWVGPPVGALADITAPGPSTGIAVASHEPAAFARAMRDMATLPQDARCEWGAQARARVVRDYDLDMQTERLRCLIKEATEKAGR